MRLMAMILTLPVAGCMSDPRMTGPSAEVICVATAEDRKNHAAALAEDGGDASVVTGARLISRIDAGCAML